MPRIAIKRNTNTMGDGFTVLSHRIGAARSALHEKRIASSERLCDAQEIYRFSKHIVTAKRFRKQEKKQKKKKPNKNNAERTLMRLEKNSPFYLRTLWLREARQEKITLNDRNVPIHSTRCPVRRHEYRLALNFMLIIIKS